MLLQETVESLCETPLYRLSPTTYDWVLQPQPCSLAAYDRFISDRAFGQKKRVLTTPGSMPELTEGYYRVGVPDSGAVFMWESVNTDVDKHGAYLHVYMLRQLHYELKVLVRQVLETLPTGQEMTGLVEVPETHWCDLDFYSSSQSPELDVQHAQSVLITPSFITLPPDCVVSVGRPGGGAKRYRIVERFEVLHSCHHRVVLYSE